MSIAHYGYLVLKMPSPAGVLTMRGNRAAALAAVEKLHALAAEAARPDDGGRNPSTSGTKEPTKVSKVRPSGADDVLVKAVQLCAGEGALIVGGDVEAIKAKEVEARQRMVLGGLAAETEPELDQFMEAYHEVLVKFREELMRLLQEAMKFM
eukprot:XP_008657539.1 homeobox protein knotted-1-like 7 [Zea mays]